MKIWIREPNLRPMFEFASSLVGYDFGEIDWDAVALGVRDTDVENEKWFDYTLAGDRTLTLQVALDPGSPVVFVCTDADAELETRLEDVAGLMAHYSLSR